MFEELFDPTTVRVRAPIRTHHKSRTNRKWKKRYGTIEFSIPFDKVNTPSKWHAQVQFMRGLSRHGVRVDWKTLDNFAPNHQDQMPGQPLANNNQPT